MSRFARRVDGNHAAIVDALRTEGDAAISVVSLASCGNGVPDLLVGYRGLTYLAEVKDGSRAPSEQRLTNDQECFVATWRGTPVVVLHSPTEARVWVQGLP